ncbi:MAG: sulfatase family protein [Actinomycetota bacterium]
MSSLRSKFAAAIAVTAVAVAIFQTSGAAEPSRPNIVVIMTDDQTVDQLAYMQATRSLIGTAGATFTDSYSSFPLCCPSRATFLTGRYAHNHGVLENEGPTGGYYRLDSPNTLPVWLQAAGYRTVHVGKYLNDYGTENPTEIPVGWHEWLATTDPSTYGMWGYTMNENGTLHTYGEFDVEDPALYQTDVLRDKAVDAIHRNAGSPFFMTFWTLAPHREVHTLLDQDGPRPAPRHKGMFADVPLPRPPSFNEEDMSDKPLYMRLKPSLDDAAIALIEQRWRDELESLQAVDEAVAAIVQALDEEGVLDDTYVVFTSDNGFFHGEHRTPVEKILGYEPSSKVPFLIRGPGIAPGTVVDELSANIDLAPTIVELTGAIPTKPIDGRSLLPFSADPSLHTRRPVLLQSTLPLGGSTLQFFTEQAPASATAGFAVSEAAAGPLDRIPLSQAVLPYQAIHTDRYVLIQYLTGERELFDLAVDPWQISSKHLDPKYLRTQLALTLELLRLRFCSGPACGRETGPIPPPAG